MWKTRSVSSEHSSFRLMFHILEKLLNISITRLEKRFIMTVRYRSQTAPYYFYWLLWPTLLFKVTYDPSQWGAVDSLVSLPQRTEQDGLNKHSLQRLSHVGASLNTPPMHLYIIVLLSMNHCLLWTECVDHSDVIHRGHGWTGGCLPVKWSQSWMWVRSTAWTLHSRLRWPDGDLQESTGDKQETQAHVRAAFNIHKKADSSTRCKMFLKRLESRSSSNKKILISIFIIFPSHNLDVVDRKWSSFLPWSQTQDTWLCWWRFGQTWWWRRSSGCSTCPQEERAEAETQTQQILHSLIICFNYFLV